MVRSALLHDVAHGFTGRAEGDLRRTNPGGLATLAAALGARGAVQTVSQVHGNRVVRAESLGEGPPEEADALVARTPGVVVAVRVADCVPVLLAGPGGQVVAAVHAGWRGTAADIVRASLAELRRSAGDPALPIRAAIGPCIRGCCYEVGDEVIAGVGAVAPGRTWLRGRQVDLAEANRAILAAEGVEVEVVGGCTRCGGAWYSHRAGDAERQLGVVVVSG